MKSCGYVTYNNNLKQSPFPGTTTGPQER